MVIFLGLSSHIFNESQLNRAKAQLEAIQLNAERWAAKAENLENAYKAKKSVVDAMMALLKEGIDGQMILDWNAFLEKLGNDIEIFGKDLEGYAKVQELITAKEKEVKNLKARAYEQSA